MSIDGRRTDGRTHYYSPLRLTSGDNNSAKNVRRVTVVNLCTSSGHALYLCQDREIFSNGIKAMEWTRMMTL